MELNVFEVKDFCEKTGYYAEIDNNGGNIDVHLKKDKGDSERPCSVCPKYKYNDRLENYMCSSWNCICE